jgi:hypothetical protein
LCCFCSARWCSVMPWVHDLQQRWSRGSFRIFKVCRMVCSLSNATVFSITVILTDTYIYTFIRCPYIQTFLEWSFMPKNQNLNHSVWLILHSNTLVLKCMKWIKSTLCCDCYNTINWLFYSTQFWAKNIGRPCKFEDARNLYVMYVCKNHFLHTDFTTPERNDRTEGHYHVAETQIHKMQLHSFLIPHSQIWIQYPQFYLHRRTFMSSHPREPMASWLCPHPVFRHLLLSMNTVHAISRKFVQSSPHQQQPACLQLKTPPVPYCLLPHHTS